MKYFCSIANLAPCKDQSCVLRRQRAGRACGLTSRGPEEAACPFCICWDPDCLEAVGIELATGAPPRKTAHRDLAADRQRHRALIRPGRPAWGGVVHPARFPRFLRP